ncbi:6-bladed beta-propeller [Parabacteroides sp. OttesenSCG-928-J18]|nr:6-bladed beta-propeller [Parabacteroides sp. OttesenSCG-928-J18]
MKNKWNGYLLFCVFLLLTGCHPKQKESPLLDFTLGEVSSLSVEEFLGRPLKEIPLETTSECLIGRIGKLIKRNGIYHIASDDKVIHSFDGNGRFLYALDQVGNGPGEYVQFMDFDVYQDNNGVPELWLSDMKKIKIYRLTDQEWIYTSSIDFDFVVHKFHPIDENRLLLVTGQNEQTLTVTDRNGTVLQTYLDKEIPFITFKALQLMPYGNRVLFQLAMSNATVTYDREQSEFNITPIVDNKKFLPPAELKELFETYDYDYLGKLRDHSYIYDIREYGSHTFLSYYTNGSRYLAVSSDNGWKRVGLHPDPTLLGMNDTPHPFLTMGSTHSDDNTFIIYRPADKEEDNPVLCVAAY